MSTQQFPTAGPTNSSGHVLPYTVGFRVNPMRDGTCVVEDNWHMPADEFHAARGAAEDTYQQFQRCLEGQLFDLAEAVALRQARQVSDRQRRQRNDYHMELRAIESADEPGPDDYTRAVGLEGTVKAMDARLAQARVHEQVLRDQFLVAAGTLVTRARVDAMPAAQEVANDRTRPDAERVTAAVYVTLLQGGHLDRSLPQAVLLRICPPVQEPAPVADCGPRPRGCPEHTVTRPAYPHRNALPPPVPAAAGGETYRVGPGTR
jgi:hypothetical protein